MDNKSITKMEEYLLKTFSVERIVKFDEDISELFQHVFYSFSHNFDMDIDTPGIVTHFLKSWKGSVGISSISKTLPAIITGSIIEGACLSRMFHPSEEKSLELEADVMYIVGCIDEKLAKELFQDTGKAGFIKVKYSKSIDLFTAKTLVSLEDIQHRDPTDDIMYINGTKLKIMHKNLQPNKKHIQLGNACAHLVNIKQKVSGPSSEIVFENRPLLKKEEIKCVKSFLMNLSVVLNDVCEKFIETFNELYDLNSILKSVVDALLPEEKNRSFKKGEVLLTLEESTDMIEQVNEKLKNFEDGLPKLDEKMREIKVFIESIEAICSDNTDEDLVQKFGQITFCHVVQNALKASLETNPMNQEVKDEHSAFSKVSVVSIKLSNYYFEFLKDVPKILKERQMKTYTKLMILTNSVRGEVSDSQGNAISFDNVSCFYCPFWPDIAKEWVTRNRKWPSNDSVASIVKAGTFIVSKQSEPGDDHILEWRWSFSSAEITLANLRSPTMKYCYFIFKSMFYQYFKDFGGTKSLPSYIAKTCMLHVSEKNDETWWEVMGIGRAVIHLVEYMQKSLQKGSLQHYFISDLNLLAGIQDDITKQALITASNILSDPPKHFIIDSQTALKVIKIEGEVNKLKQKKVESANSHIKTSIEHFNRVTEFYEERVQLIAKMDRASWLYEYYRLLIQKDHLMKLVSAQESFLAIEEKKKEPAYNMIKEYYSNVNKPLLVRMENEIPLLRKEISYSLKEAAYLMKRFCKKCSKCLQPIRCGSEHSTCSEATCIYHLCPLCMDKNGSSTKDHEHKLKADNKCVAECYTILKDDPEEENIDLNYEATKCEKTVRETHEKFVNIVAQLGSHDKNYVSVSYDNGTIMNEQLILLFKDLIKYEDVKINNDKEEDELFEEEEGTPGELIKTNTIKDDLQDLKTFVTAYEKMKLIRKLVIEPQK